MNYRIELDGLIKDIKNNLETSEDYFELKKNITQTLETHCRIIRYNEIIDEFQYELDQIEKGESWSTYFDFSSKVLFIKEIANRHEEFIEEYYDYIDEVMQILMNEIRDFNEELLEDLLDYEIDGDYNED